jgi:predicted metal-dependent hydrolase
MAMSDPHETTISITPRKGPALLFDDSMPRFWLDGDPFKTRFFDALSSVFPEGEKFFIQCVRDYSDQITDADLKQAVKEFTYQEGQHSMVHRNFNDHLKAQGVNVEDIETQERNILGWFRRHLRKTTTLAQTAATEHLTAIMGHRFIEHPELFAGADARVRAMYYWHAVEEIEHKSVAFDVLKTVARGGYFIRILTLLWITYMFTLHIFVIMNHMLRIDGFSRFARVGLWLRGLWWLYRPGGVLLPLLPHYLAYFRPGFHPWQTGSLRVYRRWREAYEKTGDVIYAGEFANAT